MTVSLMLALVTEMAGQQLRRDDLGAGAVLLRGGVGDGLDVLALEQVRPAISAVASASGL